MPIVTVTTVALAGGAVVVAHAVPAGAGLEQRPPAGAPGLEPAWRWPAPIWAGRRPQISDGWGSPRDGGARRHRGADVGYWRTKGELPQFAPGTRQASRGGAFVMPDGTPVLAMASGEVWSVTYSDRGIMVVVSHGKPWATFYQHLRTCRWPARKGAPGGPIVRAGQPLGEVGNGYNPGTADPDGYNHPHVEIWRGGAAESAVDPKPYLARATHGAAVPW